MLIAIWLKTRPIDEKNPVFWQSILEIGVFIFTIFPQFPNQNSSRNGELKILKFPEIPQMGKNWGQALLIYALKESLSQSLFCT